MLTIFSAIAEFEGELILQCQREGILVSAAIRADKSNFDCVQIHATHYLQKKFNNADKS